jgi:pimeloyl-ACP methyl ester carboxylesterase
MATSTSTLGPIRTVELPEGTIRYHETGPADGPVIVFVHGIIANADVWRHVVPALASRYRCITPDWPLGGHTAPMSPGTDLTLPGLADLVDRTLDALGLEQVTLVGNDTGGAVCQTVAARHPQRLAALVLTPCDAFNNFLPLPIRHLQLFGRTPAGLRLLAETLRWRPIYRLPIAFGLLTRRPIPNDIMASYTGPLREHAGTRRDFAQLVRGISRRFTEQAADALPTFDKPALIAWARQDFFPLAHGQRLAGLLPAGELAVIEDSGPFVGEDAPIQLAELIADFLERRVRSQSAVLTAMDA